MDSRAQHRRKIRLTVLFCSLLLVTMVERRLAELDFDSTGIVRIENDEKADGDEIVSRLIFIADTAEPRVPSITDACHAAISPLESRPHARFVVRLSESRAPPFVLPSHV